MSSTTKLVRGVSLIGAVSIVIGSIIGNGVFLKTAIMSQQVNSPLWVLAAWAVGGFLSITGALAYAELGAMMPEAGGEYIFLREGLGDLPAFLYGWTRFLIASPASIAASAVAAMTFLSGLVDLSPLGGPAIVSALMIFLFSGLNCLSVVFGGHLQTFMTTVKILIIATLLLGILFFAGEYPPVSLGSALSTNNHFPGFSAFGTAVIAALWAYDGWGSLPMVAGEIKNPSRNIPLSLFIGVGIVLAIYGSLNLAYFYALPFDEILTSNSSLYPEGLPVATKAAMTFLGPLAMSVLSAAFIFSSLGAMNSGILTNSRVPFALAKDGFFLKQIAVVSEKEHVPYVSIMVQAGMASLFAMSGTFDQLTNYVVFALWIFYALVTFTVIRLRKTKPNAERPYRTLGYPILPAIFILVAGLLLVNTLYTSPMHSAIGLGLILSGVPVYFWFKKSKQNTATP